jgi:hypothetical protein
VTLEALGGEMADFGGAHSRRQVLRAERPSEVVDAHLENGDAVDLAIGVADRNDLGAGEHAPGLRDQARVEAVKIEDHDVGRIDRGRHRRGFRSHEDSAAARLQN